MNRLGSRIARLEKTAFAWEAQDIEKITYKLKYLAEWKAICSIIEACPHAIVRAYAHSCLTRAVLADTDIDASNLSHEDREYFKALIAPYGALRAMTTSQIEQAIQRILAGESPHWSSHELTEKFREHLNAKVPTSLARSIDRQYACALSECEILQEIRENKTPKANYNFVRPDLLRNILDKRSRFTPGNQEDWTEVIERSEAWVRERNARLSQIIDSLPKGERAMRPAGWTRAHERYEASLLGPDAGEAQRRLLAGPMYDCKAPLSDRAGPRSGFASLIPPDLLVPWQAEPAQLSV